MAQSGNLKATKKDARRSAGAIRKAVGVTIKHKNYTNKHLNKNAFRDQAASSYINSVETSMASRLPSDQRSKLTMVKGQGGPSSTVLATTNKKHMKKPLTRGRKRK